jgi:hypothetical protein
MVVLFVWAIGLFVPPVGALLWWKWSVGRWWMHLLFAPALVGFEYVLISGLFYATGDTGEGPPGLGLALLPLAAGFMLTAATYYTALTIRGLASLSGRGHEAALPEVHA